MAAGAAKKLYQYTYTGDKRNWTLEKYATFNKERHKITESLVEHRCTGIDQIPKFGYLSNGINNTGLDSIKTLIVSDEGLRRDFDRCVTLYKDFV